MRRPLCLCCLFFVILIIGIAELFPYEYEFSGMEKENGEIVLVEGKVRQKEVKNKNGQNTYIICLEQIMSPSVSDADNVRDKNSNLKKLNKAEGISCYIEDSYVPNIGSVVRVKGKLSVFERPDNPGEFNMPLYYKIKGIDLQMYDCSLVAVGENYSRLKEKLFRVKMKMAGLIDICFKEKYAGLAKAILFAMNTESDEEIKQLYKDNGMLHVLCVSGVHISILGMGLYKLLSKIKIPGGINIGICILCMVLYGIMIGMGTSVFRAIVMFAMKLLARFLKRTYDVLTSACVGAFLILIEQPLYIYHSGFLLSFLSVIGLGSLNQIFPKKICKFVLADKIFQKFFSTLSVWIFTLPVYGRYYYEVSLSGLLLNVLLLPLVGVVLCLVICVCALGTAFVPWGQQVAMLCEGIFYVFEIFLKGAQKNGRVTYIIGYAGILKCLLFYTGIILVLYLSEKIKKRYIYLLIMFLCAGILIKMPPSLTIT